MNREATPEGAGRTIFKRFAVFINAILAIARLLPKRFYASTWFLVDGLPGKPGMFLRYIYVARLAKRCGTNVMVGKHVTVLGWSGLSFGDNVTVHVGCYLDATGDLTIGDNVSIAHATSILSFEHSWDDRSTPIKYNPLRFEPVEIESDVWVGCGVRILAGACIQSRSVIAAGAVVRRGVYPSGVYVGVPAKLAKAFEPVC
jgi:acetyltransferase-like isoleucine patch superfamily enzyme